jgi:hypothetical protein
MKQFKVDRREAEQFAKLWTRNGIVIPLNAFSIDYATDFANVVLSNFIIMCEQKALEAKRAAARKMVLESLNEN